MAKAGVTKKTDPGLGRTVARLLQESSKRQVDRANSHIGRVRMFLIFAPSAVSGLHLIRQKLSLTSSL